ncbi:hypothetical protein H4R23_000811 [Coemansia sp. Cherry 401B]|nr:hypothetical protein IWW52_000879 [Coemansia sp. RSA 2704]KAJ2368909.1 hypothetical protein H4S01_001320 [Coemansia sp. RSA 2610]KAJ2738932.1 hypothetical protein H4R23_000811 [Coemansia sp. Cherry 401B]
MAIAGANVSTERRNFFMSSAQLEALEKKEALEQDPLRQKLGSPLRAGARILSFELCGDNTAVLALSSHQAKTADLAALECSQAAAKHAGPVTAVAVLGKNYTVGGSRIALSASWDKQIKLWPVDSPQTTLAVLSGHSDFVKCLAAHPTLPIVYSGSADKSILYWRLPESADALAQSTGPLKIAPFKTVKGQHTGQIHALCLDPASASILYSTGSDASVRAWHAQTGDAIASAGGSDSGDWHIARGQHKTNVFDCRATENTLWTASADNTAIGWDIDTRAADMVLEHGAAVTAVLPVPQVGVVVTGVRDGAIYVWRVSSGTPEIVREIHAHTDDVTCLRAAGRVLYSAGLDGTLRRWDIQDVLGFDGGLNYIPAELQTLESPQQPQQQRAHEQGSSTSAMQSALTEEEERELAELMSDLDD